MTSDGEKLGVGCETARRVLGLKSGNLRADLTIWQMVIMVDYGTYPPPFIRLMGQGCETPSLSLIPETGHESYIDGFSYSMESCTAIYLEKCMNTKKARYKTHPQNRPG